MCFFCKVNACGVILTAFRGYYPFRSAVDSAIFGIQWAHHLAGLPSPSDSPIIHAVSRAAKRIIGTRVCNKKEPVSPDMIRKLVEKSNLDNLLELRNVCVFILAFAGFFRIEEVLHN